MSLGFLRQGAVPHLFLLLVLLGFHARSLGNGFHYDDEHSLLHNPHLRSLGALPTFFADARTFSENPAYAMYRPLVVTAHALNYALGGYEPRGYLVLNLGIHCLATLLVFHLLGQLGFARLPALGGALLFGLHPAQSEVVNYISSRSESMAGLFCLASFSAYLRALAAPARRLWAPLSWLALLLALLCKSTALALPLLLLLHHYLFKPRRSVRDHLPYWVLSVLYLLLYFSLSGQGVERAAQVRDLPSQLATQAKALVHYLLLSFMPVHLNIQQQFFASPALFSALPLLGLLVGGSLAWWAWRARSPWVPFALGWFLLCLLPTLVVPLNILVNDHRLYLALFGLALLAARWATPRRTHWPLWVLCLLLGALCFMRAGVWKDEVTLWQDAARRAPLMAEAQYNLGHAYHQRGDLEHARRAYEKAVALSPDYVRAQVNLGAIYREIGEVDKAAKAFEQALAAEPGMVEALNNLGLVYAGQGQHARAIALYQQALARAPEQAEIWLNLGLACRDSGRREEAFQALSRAIQLDPSLKERLGP
ncbi:MAG: tetratricopeptide repeat protein [Candidatus Latescibacteria bacterium]|nr:tetratricopeptide repeat protein [Candidatus Latescibacterota bacterium]